MPAEHSAQPISEEILGARRQGTSAVPNKAMFVTQGEHRAQPFITEFDGARTHGITLDPTTETLEKDRECCAMPDISAVDMARTMKTKSNLETTVIEAEIHAENRLFVIICSGLFIGVHHSGLIHSILIVLRFKRTIFPGQLIFSVHQVFTRD